MKDNTVKLSISSNGPAFAAPLADASPDSSLPHDAKSSSMKEVDQRMLLFRLSDAASRIRGESDLIRRTGFTDASSRLLRILGETIEEQRLALAGSASGGDGK